ncbi:endolytic transglycosylase MltG [Candidatus Dojkabacteria bacterium]|nr:endolytic transglycosylase MltG [Candidatus Dojkabacteria bacterium]
MKKFVNALLIILFILIILAGVGFFFTRQWYIKTVNTPASSSEEVVRFEIKLGQDINTTARELKNEGLINNVDAFYWYLRLNNLIPEIKAGTFVLKRNMTIVEIANALQNATADDTVWITIPEGLRMDEVGTILEEKLQGNQSKFVRSDFDDMVKNPDNYTFSSSIRDFLTAYKPEKKSLEGFLYPDTYNFAKNITTQQAIERLITTLISKFKDEDYAAIEKSNLNFYETLILASIIEREAFTKDEKHEIADVLLKRLKGELDGVKLLQVDAALLYEKKDWKANAFLLKEKDSLYNTYKYPGLTPTPISNPGIDSINAVIYPGKNEYFYYLHGNDGQIHYAKTLSEHNENKKQYIDSK